MSSPECAIRYLLGGLWRIKKSDLIQSSSRRVYEPLSMPVPMSGSMQRDYVRRHRSMQPNPAAYFQTRA